MERFANSARSDRYGSRINRDRSPWRAVSVPYITIMLASMLPFLVMADVMPVLPPLGYLMFLGWRIMRPGLLPIWVGVPLGAFDDLFSGQPFGSAILLWSLTMIVIELIESRFPWRGFIQDWFTASLGVVAYILVAMTVSGSSLTPAMIVTAVPQMALAILLYPIFAKVISRIDRFRLARARRIG
ncbi:MAG: rod shape-determining protein MreD [Pseudomonadota bacterium]